MEAPGGGAVDQEDWLCPICRELVYKPCVNICGHVFCFWCVHHAMSPLSPSKCPLCRSIYTHFPKICELLHSFMSQAFHSEYCDRIKEVKEEEEERSAFAPDLGTLPEAPAGGKPGSEFFLCESPACGTLLLDPVVLNCGHVVCQRHCPEHPPEEAQGTGDAAGGAAAGGGARLTCPKCGLVTVGTPSVCTTLQNYISKEFPERVAADRVRAAADAAVDAAATPPAPPRVPLRERVEVAVGTGSVPVGGAAAGQEQGHGQGQGVEAGGELGQEGGPLPGAERRERPPAPDPETFTHFGVGCDLCGIYPIVGRRFKCEDCPEDIGFDLCGACMSHHQREVEGGGGGTISGRFSQEHTKEHTIVEVEPLPRLLHHLMSVHPGMSAEQIMRLLEMQAQMHQDDGIDENGEDGEDGEDGEEAGRGSDDDAGDEAALLGALEEEEAEVAAGRFDPTAVVHTFAPESLGAAASAGAGGEPGAVGGAGGPGATPGGHGPARVLLESGWLSEPTGRPGSGGGATVGSHPLADDEGG